MNKKRIFSGQFKAKLVTEYLKGLKSRAEICKEHAIGSNLLDKWTRQFEESSHLIFENQDNQEEKIEKLERIIGKQAIEIDFLKRGLSIFGK